MGGTRTAVELSANTATTVADTFVDVTGSSLGALGAGTYELCYHGQANISKASGGNPLIVFLIEIEDGTSTVNESVSSWGYSDWTGNNSISSNVSKCVETTIGGSTTFNLRIKCSVASATAACSWVGTNSAYGALTDPDNESIFTARQVSP
jgi:hypothetical protein